jgi:flagellar hook assembly protein FlgD
VNRLAGAVFAVLAVATFAAFFVAQRLKHGPTVVQSFHRAPAVFSPNNDGRFDVERFSFTIKKSDDVTVDIVTAQGDPIKRLVSDEHLDAYRRIATLRWNGRTDSGARAPDGVYRVRVILRSQDRSVVVPKKFGLDTTPPQVEVVGVGARGKVGPEIIQTGGAGTQIHVDAPGHHRIVTIYRTDVSPAVVVRMLPIPDTAPARTSVPWDGKDATGKPVPAGVYLAGIQARDEAGNRGTSPPLTRAGLPITRYGLHLRGHGGITVSDVVVQPPLVPTPAGQPVHFFVGSHHQPYTWSVRRVGSVKRVAGGTSPSTGAVALTVNLPSGPSGVYLLQVHANHTTMRVPFGINGPPAGGTAAAPKGVLVVLPAISWQGLNPVDSDGDGEPDTLNAGIPVSLNRAFTGLPVNFAHGEANALIGLDHRHDAYDVNTDLGLVQGTGPAIAAHRGVLLAGDERRVTDGLAKQLRAFVHGGGVLVSLGTDSLMRRVSITPTQRLYMPTGRATTDIFGARILPLVTRPVTLTNFADSPAVQLFLGTVGQFTGYRRYEPTASLGTRMSLASDAVDGVGRPVIVAAHYGRGLVIRVGLPDFAASLVASHQTAQLYDRLWTLLSR